MMFIHVEPAGPEPDAPPVELGLAWLGRGQVLFTSHLVGPRPGRRYGTPDPRRADRHGIPRWALDRAPLPADVATWVLDVCGSGRLAALDAPEARRHLSFLFEAGTAGPAPSVVSACELIATELGSHGARRARAHLDAHSPQHRAAPDAHRLAGAWLAAICEGRRAGEAMGPVAAGEDAAAWRPRRRLL